MRILVHVLVYAGAATMILPFIWMIATSLKTDHEAVRARCRSCPRARLRSGTGANSAEAVRSTRLDRYYVNSTIAAAVTTLLAGIHNALAGFALAKLRFKGRTMVLWACLATMMLPFQVSFIFAYLVCRWFGYLDSLQAIIVPFLASGFGIYYMRQAVFSVPDSVLEAGRLDGMSNLELFWHIVHPTIWPAIAALGVFTFVVVEQLLLAPHRARQRAVQDAPAGDRGPDRRQVRAELAGADGVCDRPDRPPDLRFPPLPAGVRAGHGADGRE